jgi:hypothetical protein
MYSFLRITIDSAPSRRRAKKKGHIYHTLRYPVFKKATAALIIVNQNHRTLETNYIIYPVNDKLEIYTGLLIMLHIYISPNNCIRIL